MNFMSECKDIHHLPDVLVVDLTENNYLIEMSTNQTLNIFCDDKLHHKIGPKIGIMKITLPPNCSLIGENVKIGKDSVRKSSADITSNEVVAVADIYINPWQPFYRNVHNIIEISEREDDLLKDSIDSDPLFEEYNKYERELALTTSQIETMSKESNSILCDWLI